MTGRKGDVLTREGEQVGQLYYLASGEAKVVSHGRMVGTCRTGQLIGEGTILSPDAATATVTLTEASRFWCAPAKALNAYLATNDDVRHVLEHGFNQSLARKAPRHEPRQRRPGLIEQRAAKQQQQPNVDPDALGAALLDERGDRVALDEVDDDLLMPVEAAALADARQSMRADQV